MLALISGAAVAAMAFPSTIAGWAMCIIFVAAVIAIVFIACKKLGVPIPDWFIQVFWVVVVALVCIFAVKFLAQAM